jgi:hypothetical protein
MLVSLGVLSKVKQRGLQTRPLFSALALRTHPAPQLRLSIPSQKSHCAVWTPASAIITSLNCR